MHPQHLEQVRLVRVCPRPHPGQHGGGRVRAQPVRQASALPDDPVGENPHADRDAVHRRGDHRTVGPQPAHFVHPLLGLPEHLAVGDAPHPVFTDLDNGHEADPPAPPARPRSNPSV